MIFCMIFIIFIGVVLFCCIRVSADADNYMEMLMEKDFDNIEKRYEKDE